MEFLIDSIEKVPAAAQKIISQFRNKKVVCFFGEMGAGKTTLIKAICRELGVISSLSSPTFSLVNEYETEKGEIIYHFDFYRLETEEEALDYGLEEYFDSGNLCLLEWPGRIPSLLPTDVLAINITLDLEVRIIKLT